MHAFDEYCNPKKNELLERYNFIRRKREEGKPFHNFLTDIKTLVKSCDCGDQEDKILRDQIVFGQKHYKKLQNKLLEAAQLDGGLDLTKAINICRIDETTEKNKKVIQGVGVGVDLAKILRDSIQNYSLRIGRTEADLQDLRHAVERQARYSTAIREIELAILEMKFSLVELQESLDLTSVGKLSSTLINPQNLSELLKQVSLHLPTGTSMLTGLTVEEMYVYYAVTNVHATATSRSIRLFIDVPLKAADIF
jgi:hypothetical protein